MSTIRASASERVNRLFSPNERWWTIASLLLVLGLVAYKAEHLSLPYYWDEAWVYHPAVDAMQEHGPSLSSSALDPELGRGHPLFFHASAAAWGMVFGNGRSSYHSFALLLSACLVLTTYAVGRALASPFSGFAAALLLVAYESFLAQSALLLPEILLALLTLISVWAYWERWKWVLTASTSLMLLTKETGAVVLTGMFVWMLAAAVTKTDRDLSTSSLASARWAAFGLLPFALFLVDQYHVRGWVFYPEHMDMIGWSLGAIRYKIELIHKELFEAQGAEWITYCFGILTPIPVFRRKPFLALATVLLFTLSIKGLYGRWPLPHVPAVITTVIGAFFGLGALLKGFRMFDPRFADWLGCATCVIILFTGFTAINFFSDRYLIPLVPLLVTTMSATIIKACDTLHVRLAPVLMSVLVIVRFSLIGSDKKVGDTRLGYVDSINAYQEFIANCAQRGLQDVPIHATFMTGYYMTRPEAGYLMNSRPFSHVIIGNVPKANLTVVSSDDLLDSKSDRRSSGHQEVLLIRRGGAWVGLFQRAAELQ